MLFGRLLGYLVFCSLPGWSASSLQFSIFTCICALVTTGLEEPFWCFPGVYLWVLCYESGDPCRLGACQPGCGGSVFVCTQGHLECPFDRQYLVVRVMHLSPRQCQGSLGFWGNWVAVISREAFLCSRYTTDICLFVC